ncbi:hypothetical protein HMPREF9306_01649 [Propionimicrobium lymphophilum ACS-093-V-SCH5]|uniref:Uncharacterized protein n=1 Tax=Propionimicrobium lymphophilum ACS-093-V-SCH5 TaxID=883161 RepID=S2W144_9ACTN|nr:DUF2017 family protein [Propionimicrobium lymphophilum]EPD32085.1 hypothetical protein HMPREF9306_01649 [Propionimicrobium lymphophilum ACS-093-V-SCH5]
MHAFERVGEATVCRFEPAEIEILRSLLCQLLGLITDDSCFLQPGQQLGDCCCDAGSNNSCCEGEDAILAELDRQFTSSMQLNDPMYFAHADPVIKRLFPPAYLDDEEANFDFQRFSAPSIFEDKVVGLRAMLSDLADNCSDDGVCSVPGEHLGYWLKTLTSLRLALAVRLGISTSTDAEALAEIGQDDPRSFAYSIYEWLGFVQESLLAVCE